MLVETTEWLDSCETEKNVFILDQYKSHTTVY